MPLAVDLVSVGIAPELARRLGYADLISQVASTSIAPATNNLVAITEVGAASFTFSSNTEMGRPMLVSNLTPENCLLRAPNSGTINGQTQVSIAQWNMRVVIRLDSTRWISFVTA